jgi:hypothetical protein
VAEAPHKRIHSGPAPSVRCTLFEPFPKGGIQYLMLGLSHQPRLLDKAFVGAQGYIFHENSVHYIRVV